MATDQPHVGRSESLLVLAFSASVAVAACQSLALWSYFHRRGCWLYPLAHCYFVTVPPRSLWYVTGYLCGFYDLPKDPLRPPHPHQSDDCDQRHEPTWLLHQHWEIARRGCRLHRVPDGVFHPESNSVPREQRVVRALPALPGGGHD